MKVLLVNGSPHRDGCTNRALAEIASALRQEGIDSQTFWIGTGPVRGCIACGACRKLGRCAFDDDKANELASRMHEADGIVIGSPVYYAGPSGALCALLDRVFFSGGDFTGKPAAAVTSSRRPATPLPSTASTSISPSTRCRW